jgi:hypothetical protein
MTSMLAREIPWQVPQRITAAPAGTSGTRARSERTTSISPSAPRQSHGQTLRHTLIATTPLLALLSAFRGREVKSRRQETPKKDAKEGCKRGYRASPDGDAESDHVRPQLAHPPLDTWGILPLTALDPQPLPFISGKKRTQEELFHTLYDLYEARHQIVLSSASIAITRVPIASARFMNYD